MNELGINGIRLYKLKNQKIYISNLYGLMKIAYQTIIVFKKTKRLSTFVFYSACKILLAILSITETETDFLLAYTNEIMPYFQVKYMYPESLVI